MSKNAFPEEKEMEYRSYTKKHRSGAFTLAEFLVVIAITLILAGVSFVAAIRYQSSLRRMEMDRTAKEIFLAAQNNLSLAKSGGVMGMTRKAKTLLRKRNRMLPQTRSGLR